VLLLLLACMAVEMTDSDSTAVAAEGIALTPTSQHIPSFTYMMIDVTENREGNQSTFRLPSG
jgi:hypothetical protein